MQTKSIPAGHYRKETHHRLQVHLRVPVRVVEDDDVGRRQVDAEAAGARRQHEDELFAVRLVEGLDRRLAVLVRRLQAFTDCIKLPAPAQP